jgi:hypothetical protein
VRQWYYIKESTRIGPVTERVMSELIASRTISTSTLVWTEGMKGWEPLASRIRLTPPEGAKSAPPINGPAARGQMTVTRPHRQTMRAAPASNQAALANGARVSDGTLTPMQLLSLLERLNSLDPIQTETQTRFLQVMDGVLRNCSVHEGTKIAQSEPPSAPTRLFSGAARQAYQELMLERATIRREIERQGAAGLAEEKRLQNAVEQWTAGVERLRATAKPEAVMLQTVQADFRRATMILDSIARRNLDTLRAAISRFHQLQAGRGH